MKNISIKTISLALVMGCTACSDVLDKGPLDKFSENDVWESAELAQAFLYPSLSYATGQLVWNDKWTDNDVIQDDGGASNVNKEQIDRYYDAGWNPGADKDKAGDVYSNIRKCNLMLQKMEENTTFLEQDKKLSDRTGQNAACYDLFQPCPFIWKTDDCRPRTRS